MFKKMMIRINQWIIQLLYNSPLKYKMIIAYSLFVMIPILFIGLTSHYISRDYMISSEEKALKQNMIQLRDTIDYFFEIYVNKSELLFNNVPLQQELMGEKDNIYEVAMSYYRIKDIALQVLNDVKSSYLKGSNYFSGQVYLTFYSHNKSLSTDGQYVIPFEKIEQEPWIKQLYQSQNLFVWHSEIPDHNKHEYITLSRRLLDFKTIGDLGVMRIFIPIERIRNLFTENNHNSEYSLLLVDEHFNKVASAGPLFLSEIDMKDNIELLRLNKKNNEIHMNGETYIVSYVKSDITDWKLYYLTPTGLITDKVNFITYITLMTMIISIFVCILIATMISSMLTKRINMLVVKTNQIKEGDLFNDIKIKGNDEIGQLDKNFNRMMLRIIDLIENVYESKIVINQTKLELLQEQINPHLYYNSLAMIGYVAKQSNQPDIVKVTQNLISFYKSILNKGEIISSLKSEIEMVSHYIEIMKFVYHLDIMIEIDIEKDIMEFYSIKLFLQPIVENAVLHGIRPCKSGLIQISGNIIDNVIEFTVSDDGIGMPEDVTRHIRNPTLENPDNGKGYGLKNVMKRLQLFFGESYGIQIESAPGVGTMIVVRIPILTEHQINTLLKNKYSL